MNFYFLNDSIEDVYNEKAISSMLIFFYFYQYYLFDFPRKFRKIYN